MKEKVEVKRNPKQVPVQAWIHESGSQKRHALQFDANGVASVELAPGAFVLVYALVTTPGTDFTIALTEPPEAVWSRSHRVPADGITIGTKKFVVRP